MNTLSIVTEDQHPEPNGEDAIEATCTSGVSPGQIGETVTATDNPQPADSPAASEIEFNYAQALEEAGAEIDGLKTRVENLTRSLRWAEQESARLDQLERQWHRLPVGPDGYRAIVRAAFKVQDQERAHLAAVKQRKTDLKALGKFQLLSQRQEAREAAKAARAQAKIDAKRRTNERKVLVDFIAGLIHDVVQHAIHLPPPPPPPEPVFEDKYEPVDPMTMSDEEFRALFFAKRVVS